ncbi:HipA domain-containing protein [uncultured Sulfitobacter sp.]|uniref:type II toxin-antitoxin system HipA family toxin n=1 Tax=uncultured Sulfitobacter sp. TaxID=191468 RepID=UPI0030FB79AB
MALTIQINIDGQWHNAAQVGFTATRRGINSGAWLSYETDYWAEHASVDALGGPVIDHRAVSVQFPVDVTYYMLGSWPSFLLDLLPQGPVRGRIAGDQGLRPDDPKLDVLLLAIASSTPVGNIRIRQAWKREQENIRQLKCPSLTDADVLSVSSHFINVLDTYVNRAPGATCVQGEWPKVLLTRSKRDGFLYPDPYLKAQDGAEHFIAKLAKTGRHADELILASEAPYLEMARVVGLNCGAPLKYGNGILLIPRFDRSVSSEQVLMHGQESLYSAMGITEFGARRSHEDYLAVIDQFSDDPVADRIEYLKRDVLNITAGNPDNHGRNTALCRNAAGGTRLSPLFDFAPMRLSDAGIARAARWRCLGNADPGGDWSAVCEAVACDGLSSNDTKDILVAMLPQLFRLREIAGTLGVASEVIRRVIFVERMTSVIEALRKG